MGNDTGYPTTKRQMNESPLLLRLSAIRAKARRRLFAYGVLLVVTGGVVAFLTVAVLDWMIWLPSVLRIFVAGAYLVGFVAASLILDQPPGLEPDTAVPAFRLPYPPQSGIDSNN